MGAAGVVMWGNRRDENTSPEVCTQLNDYIKTKLGPYFESVRHRTEVCSQKKCKGRGRCVDSRLISARWVAEEPRLYAPTCKGSLKLFSPFIRQHSSHHNHRGIKLFGVIYQMFRLAKSCCRINNPNLLVFRLEYDWTVLKVFSMYLR